MAACSWAPQGRSYSHISFMQLYALLPVTMEVPVHLLTVVAVDQDGLVAVALQV